MKAVRLLQLTLAVVKPDAVAHPLILEVRRSEAMLLTNVVHHPFPPPPNLAQAPGARAL